MKCVFEYLGRRLHNAEYLSEVGWQKKKKLKRWKTKYFLYYSVFRMRGYRQILKDNGSRKSNFNKIIFHIHTYLFGILKKIFSQITEWISWFYSYLGIEKKVLEYFPKQSNSLFLLRKLKTNNENRYNFRFCFRRKIQIIEKYCEKYKDWNVKHFFLQLNLVFVCLSLIVRRQLPKFFYYLLTFFTHE